MNQQVPCSLAQRSNLLWHAPAYFRGQKVKSQGHRVTKCQSVLACNGVICRFKSHQFVKLYNRGSAGQIDDFDLDVMTLKIGLAKYLQLHAPNVVQRLTLTCGC